MNIFTIHYRIILAGLTILLAGCSSSGTYQYDLIPIPVTFNERISESAAAESPYEGILYVTDREPSESGGARLSYRNERASALRVGLARIDYSGEPRTEAELQELADVEPGKRSDFPLSVTDITELGFLQRAMPTPFLTSSEELEDTPPADDWLISLINQKLAASQSKDIYLYIHGYNTVFENPVILAAQLWYFMNNDGVFLPFAWTATPNRFAYIKDLQTAEISARNLRLFLQFLLEQTDVERINILGYSAGTRVVIGALHQLALLQGEQSPDSAKARIGQVALVGSDYDRERWIAAVADGLVEITETLTIYVSPSDDVLRLSNLLLGVESLGQLYLGEQIPEKVRDWITSNESLYFVDITGVAGSGARSGHSYFQTSPWISSDILATLLYGMTPAERGLIQDPGELIWSFPSEYDAGLKQIIDSRTGR